MDECSVKQQFHYDTDEMNTSLIHEYVRKATVGIEISHQYSAYLGAYKHEALGTGFIFNKEKGFILTNKHVVKREAIQQNYVTFYNGEKSEASLVYDDLQHDFAIIKVNPGEIPNFVEELKLSNEEITIFQKVFMIGFNGGLNFAYQDGIITDANTIGGWFSTQLVTISLNSKGGSSGSAVCNEKGEVIALNFAGGQISAFAIPIEYIQEKLVQLEQGLVPVSKSLGVVFESCNLDNMVLFASFPKEKQKFYMESFPEAQNNIICIDKIIPTTPAEGKFELGDVIWKINDKQVTNKLYPIMDTINQASEEINIKLYRDGELQDFNITPYDLHLYSIKKMVIYNSLAFFEADEFSFLKKGVIPGQVFTGFSTQGSSLTHIQKSVIEKLGKFYIKDIDSLIEALPHLIKEKKFISITKNLSHPSKECSFEKKEICQEADHQVYSKISLDQYSNNYLVFSFNENSMQWTKVLTLSSNEEVDVKIVGNVINELYD